jgi:hypothetical protein
VTLVTPDSTESSSLIPIETPPEASLTPYLDRELPLPAPNWSYRRIRPWQTALILGAFLLRTPFEIYLLVLAVTLVHELGHCLAGLTAGLELDQVRVGPVELDSYKRLKWEWNRGTIVGGHALMLPKSKSALRARFAAFVGGGPVANITCGLIVLQMMPAQNAHFMGLAQIFVACSFVVGVGNLIPFRRYGVSSDGMKLLQLLSNSGQRWIFLLSRQAALRRAESIREEEVDPVFVAQSDGSSDYVGANWVAYTLADGKGNYDQAAKYLETCLAKCSTVTPDVREELILAAARFQATRRRKNEIARQWLNSGNKAKSRINRGATEALILFSEGKIKDALTTVDDVSELVSQLPPGRMRTLQEQAARQLREIIGESVAARPTVSDPGQDSRSSA